MFVQTFR